ncbi:hypothetical protein C0584_04885 [Candidatus Parcubacteria bacterium]|nr:MAG: hypothetical protein C0584_04885 [Candidatus Parcubacteria bacterium]
MSLKKIREIRNEEVGKDPNSLKAKVLTRFLMQPMTISNPSSKRVPVNFSNPQHRETFMGSVNRDIENGVVLSHPQKRAEIENYIAEARRILFS